MAVRALTPGATKVHVFSGDVPDPKPAGMSDEDYQTEIVDKFKPTKWHIKALDSRILGALKDKNAKVTVNVARPDEEVGTVFNQNDYAFQVVQLGLDEPENFVDGNETKIAWRLTKRPVAGRTLPCVHEDVVALIPAPVIAELAEQIEAFNSLTVTEGNG